MSQTVPPVVRAEPLPINGEADYDALADLFLGEDRAVVAPPVRPAQSTIRPTPNAATAPASVHIEGLVLGHLPVMASAWVQQYARHLSNLRHGPVALLRLRPGEAQIDLIGSRLDSPRPHATLEEAIREASEATGVWIVRVDEVTEPRLTQLPQVSTVTLLTGADEAAIVSAYRTLKNLVQPCEEGEGPGIHIAIMGATPEKAGEATQRLEGAAKAFLGRPLQIDCCIARIGGRPSAVLFRGAWSGTIEQTLASLRAPEVSRSEPAAPAPAASPTREPAFAPAAEVVSRLGHVTAPIPTTISAASPCGPLHAYIAGLRTAGIQCPYAPQVDLALDDRGVMHALGRLESVDISHLLAAATWLKSHQELLRMALQTPETDETPVLHLFTADARRVRALGDSPVRLHLLARVEANGSGTWFSTPLN